MGQRLVWFFALALGLALLDHTVKERLVTSELLLHERSAAWHGLSVAFVLATLATAAMSTRSVAAIGGLTAGGALGNLVSVAEYGAVPNPFLVGGVDGLVFNLADVFVVSGLLLLVLALASASVRHRARLRPPRRWEQKVVAWVRRSA